MRRVLFVDDEQHVLDGLQNMLRRQRNVWKMSFVSSGDEALARLAAEPFDIIVSDMRMPGMDGAALLGHVREHHPSVARMILSGQADRAAVVRALSVTQQFIAKPCSPEALREMVERVCALQSLLRDDALRGLVGTLDRLPSVPRTYSQLTQAVERPDVNAADLAEIVELDPALSVKVLQLANSAWFGVPHRTHSIGAAVSYLGADLLKSLALAAEVFAVIDGSPATFRHLEGHQDRVVATARLARRMVHGRERASQAFTAGLVHDVGQIVLALGAQARLAEVVDLARETGRRIHQVERERMGVTHAEIGAYLLGLWGLPFDIVEAVAWHHNPSQAPSHLDSEVLCAVHVADGLVDACITGEDDVLTVLDAEFTSRLDLAPRLAEWRALAEEEVALSKRGTFS